MSSVSHIIIEWLQEASRIARGYHPGAKLENRDLNGDKFAIKNFSCLTIYVTCRIISAMEVKYLTKNIIHPSFKLKAIALYQDGLSSQEIKEKLDLSHDVRSIQRWMKGAGVSRSMGDAFRLAVKKGRVHFAYKENKDRVKRHKLSPKLRYQALQRDNFKCTKCGSLELLEVDHIDENKNNNILENFQTLCHECNIGKSFNHRFKKEITPLLSTPKAVPIASFNRFVLCTKHNVYKISCGCQ